jgi:tetratricopeptide (TPR) repeat protein
MTSVPQVDKPDAYEPALSDGQLLFLKILTPFLAVLGATGLYLICIPVRAQSLLYFWVFVGHLGLGVVLTLPFSFFAVGHLIRAHDRPNRKAVKAGLALFVSAFLIIFTGFLLMNRRWAHPVVYWGHVLVPIASIVFYIQHRLAGPQIRWKWGAIFGGTVVVFVIGMSWMHLQDPRQWFVVGGGDEYFSPSSARTSNGGFIPEKVLSNDHYCKECHTDAHEAWQASAHRFSSFNNIPYRMTIRDMKKALMKRDGNTQAARWCAGCHDPVPFFSGAFDDPKFNDEEGGSQAGITCTACHAISNINSVSGNGDYTIEEPLHYPFTFSKNKLLKWVNKSLVKAKPEFHKRTFLKDEIHRDPKFCSVCHKVALIPEVNHYKWLRGQNHYDSWLLSGVSGQGAFSFYYPPASKTCNDCHMPLTASEDFGNKNGKIHDHLFIGANTGIMKMNEMRARAAGDTKAAELHAKALKRTTDFLEDNLLRIDILGLRDGPNYNAPFIGPIRPQLPQLEPGKTYILEVVVKTLKIGHHFTQGTIDSNEVWVQLTAHEGDRLLAHSGLIDEKGAVDPKAHYLNALVLDKEGHRIDRRNAQDIFVPLYNNNIPPGAGHVIHYRLHVPKDAKSLRINARVFYRKFDRTYMDFVFGPGKGLDLPAVKMAEDEVFLPVGGGVEVPAKEHPIPSHIRINDYGIGLFITRGNKRIQAPQTLQANEAFKKVTQMKPDFALGWVNVARVYLFEGNLKEARAYLDKAAPLIDAGHVAYNALLNQLRGKLHFSEGDLTAAAEFFERVLGSQGGGFDFRTDRRILNDLGQIRLLEGVGRRSKVGLHEAKQLFHRVLEVDPENLTAHWQLSKVYGLEGDGETARYHRDANKRYKPDEDAISRVASIYTSAHPYLKEYNQQVVIYNLSYLDELAPKRPPGDAPVGHPDVQE